jgi:hypothetical protein
LALFLPVNPSLPENKFICKRLKPFAMLTRFFSWIRRRFTKGNKKINDGFNDNPYLIF